MNNKTFKYPKEKAAPPAPRRGRPIDAAKRDDILRIATKLFMKQGFEATHMDQIAREAGMSKLTLYRRFPDKAALFVAVLQDRCRAYVPDSFFDDLSGKTARDTLQAMLDAVFSLIMSDDAIAVYRMMVAESASNKALAEMFYAAGPTRMRALVSAKLADLSRRGLLSIPDAEAATDVMFSLLKGSRLHQRYLLNVVKKPSAADMKALTQSIADVLMTLYGATAPRRVR